ncbi:MAG: hypothetical protein ACC742_09075 [Thermoanaerobaculales bacterium]
MHRFALWYSGAGHDGDELPCSSRWNDHARQRLFGETSPLVIQLVRGDTAPAAFDDLTLRFARALGSIEELTSVTWRAYDLEADGAVERLRAAVFDPATAGPQAWSERLSGDGVQRQLRRLRRRLLSIDDAATRAWLAEDPLDLRRLLFESDRSRSPSRLKSLALLLTLAVTLTMFPALVRWLVPSDAEATSNEPGVRLISLTVFERFGRGPALVILVWLAILGATIQATRGFSFDMRLSLFFGRDLDAFAVGEDLAEIYGTSFSQTTEVGLVADNLEVALEAQRRLDEGLRELVAAGGIGGFAAPSAYLPYPSSVAEQSEEIDQLRGTIDEIAPGLGDLLAANGLRGPPSLDRYVALLTSLWPPDPSSVTGAYNLDFAPRPLKMLAARDGDRVQLRTIVWPPPLPGAAEFDQHGRMAAELARISHQISSRGVQGAVRVCALTRFGSEVVLAVRRTSKSRKR